MVSEQTPDICQRDSRDRNETALTNLLHQKACPPNSLVLKENLVKRSNYQTIIEEHEDIEEESESRFVRQKSWVPTPRLSDPHGATKPKGN